jgi:DNA repair protein SbcD/Mre11
VRLLHFADLHLDAPFLWAGRQVAEHRRQALRDGLLAVVELAHQLGVDALVCAGDLYEQDRFTPDTARFLQATFERASPLRILVAPGNHDWFGPRSLYALVRWSPNVTVFGRPALAPVTLADGLTLWGAAHAAPAGTRGFLDGFRVDRGGVHLALFHGSVRGPFPAAAEQPDAHGPFTQAQIMEAGLHHALVGHYHTPIDGDRFTYPGNPVPLTFGETGVRGAVLATVHSDGTVATERHVVARTEVHDIPVDLTGCVSGQDVRDRLARTLASITGCVRATLCGEIAPEVDVQVEALAGTPTHLDALVVRLGDLRRTYDTAAIVREQTVRGQFARQVLGADVPEDDRLRVLDMGLRALAGRQDLERG